MKPAPFAYHRPGTVAEALAILAEAPDETSLLAGGQSLVPLLNLRLARPSVIVDLNGVADLDSVGVFGPTVRFGATVRQRRLEVDPLIRDRLPLLTEAAGCIAHLPIRVRGTIGGSLAHADPAAELPAVVAALRARLLVRRASGADQTLSPEEFFVAPLTTAIGPGGMLVAIEVDPPPAGTGWAFLEVSRVHGAFALVGAAALLHTDGEGRIDLSRLALCGVGGTPMVPSWLDTTLIGERPSVRLFEQVGRRIREAVDPPGEAGEDREYRRSVAGSLTARALAKAALRAGLEVVA